MKRGFYALFIVLLTSFGAFSQDGFQVNGRLVDTLGSQTTSDSF
jgi:hypothetical protein